MADGLILSPDKELRFKRACTARPARIRAFAPRRRALARPLGTRDLARARARGPPPDLVRRRGARRENRRPPASFSRVSPAPTRNPEWVGSPRPPRPPTLTPLAPSYTLPLLTVELRKTIPTLIKLTNPAPHALAFKVKTTAPKKYCVKPNTGVVEPGATTTVHVIMQIQKEWPADINNCKDKFLVQSAPLEGDLKYAELFDKSRAAHIREAKLRVAYAPPAAPPSPINEGEETLAGGDSTLTATPAREASKPMPTDADQMQKQLQRAWLRNDELADSLKTADKMLKEPRKGFFTIVHILITAIIAFFIARHI